MTALLCCRRTALSRYFPRCRHLRAVLADCQAHYNMARPHQGIAQRVPDGEHDAPRVTVTGVGTQHIRRKPVLGGLINEYTQAA